MRFFTILGSATRCKVRETPCPLRDTYLPGTRPATTNPTAACQNSDLATRSVQSRANSIRMTPFFSTCARLTTTTLSRSERPVMPLSALGSVDGRTCESCRTGVDAELVALGVSHRHVGVDPVQLHGPAVDEPRDLSLEIVAA